MRSTKRLCCMIMTIMLLCSLLSVTAYAAEDLVYGIGFVDATGLRLRSRATTNSDTIDVAPDGECVVVLGVSGNWYHVNYNLQEGYMHKDYLDVLTKENAELGYGNVIASRVNIRSGPSTDYRIVDCAPKGAKCYIIGLNEGWYKVIYGNSLGYIRSDYLELTECPYENQCSPNSPKFFRHGKSTGTIPSPSAIAENVPNTSSGNGSNYNGNSWNTNQTGNGNSNVWGNESSVSGQQIVNKAAQYLGTPYVYGGASPSGFDCSGLVYYVLKSFGYSPNRTPEALYTQGTFISKGNLEPGDIVFFANTGGSGITHVGIFAGDGQFIHSPNSRSTVSYASLTSGYWAEHYYGARRFH